MGFETAAFQLWTRALPDFRNHACPVGGGLKTEESLWFTDYELLQKGQRMLVLARPATPKAFSIVKSLSYCWLALLKHRGIWLGLCAIHVGI